MAKFNQRSTGFESINLIRHLCHAVRLTAGHFLCVSAQRHSGYGERAAGRWAGFVVGRWGGWPPIAAKTKDGTSYVCSQNVGLWRSACRIGTTVWQPPSAALAARWLRRRGSVAGGSTLSLPPGHWQWVSGGYQPRLLSSGAPVCVDGIQPRRRIWLLHPRLWLLLSLKTIWGLKQPASTSMSIWTAWFTPSRVSRCVVWPVAAKSTARIIRNAAFALHARLAGPACEVFSAEMRLRSNAANAVFYPDVRVHCTQSINPLTTVELTGARLVIEVLSPTTQPFNRADKLNAYRRLPGLQPRTRRLSPG